MVHSIHIGTIEMPGARALVCWGVP